MSITYLAFSKTRWILEKIFLLSESYFRNKRKTSSHSGAPNPLKQYAYTPPLTVDENLGEPRLVLLFI
jgi:hypothetical protein